MWCSRRRRRPVAAGERAGGCPACHRAARGRAAPCWPPAAARACAARSAAPDRTAPRAHRPAAPAPARKSARCTCPLVICPKSSATSITLPSRRRTVQAGALEMPWQSTAAGRQTPRRRGPGVARGARPAKRPAPARGPGTGTSHSPRRLRAESAAVAGLEGLQPLRRVIPAHTPQAQGHALGAQGLRGCVEVDVVHLLAHGLAARQRWQTRQLTGQAAGSAAGRASLISSSAPGPCWLVEGMVCVWPGHGATVKVHCQK
jgi:hypothetical protein